MMAGRIGNPEEWRFEEFGSETRLNLSGETVFLDRYLLKPAEMDMRFPWVMGNATYVGTGLCCGTNNEVLTKLLHDV
jgi:urease accessory protein UreH